MCKIALRCFVMINSKSRLTGVSVHYTLYRNKIRGSLIPYVGNSRVTVNCGSQVTNLQHSFAGKYYYKEIWVSQNPESCRSVKMLRSCESSKLKAGVQLLFEDAEEIFDRVKNDQLVFRKDIQKANY